jgi:hypothetical protein
MAQVLDRIVVARARALIANEENWCRGALAKDASNRNVDIIDPEARKWCAYGALVAAAFEFVEGLDEAHEFAAKAARKMHCCSSLINLNDIQGHAAVLAVFDEALAKRPVPIW